MITAEQSLRAYRVTRRNNMIVWLVFFAILISWLFLPQSTTISCDGVLQGIDSLKRMNQLKQAQIDTLIIQLNECNKQLAFRKEQTDYNYQHDTLINKDTLTNLRKISNWMKYKIADSERSDYAWYTGTMNVNNSFSTDTDKEIKKIAYLVDVTLQSVVNNTHTFLVNDKSAQKQYSVLLPVGGKGLDTSYSGCHIIMRMENGKSNSLPQLVFRYWIKF